MELVDTIFFSFFFDLNNDARKAPYTYSVATLGDLITKENKMKPLEKLVLRRFSWWR
jgi:hypothetical protein